jgi:iron complex transport system ATP-binding protein
MTQAIAVSQVSAAYNDNRVVNRLSFEVEPMDFFVIIGPNGSGKTTLLKLMARLQHPVEGRIEVFGKLLSKYSRKSLSKKIAYVPQLSECEFPFTVREVISMGRACRQGILGIDNGRDAKVVEEAMVFTGVDRFSDRRVHQLSGGERQRVFISRAIAQEPEIMLLDEPTAALDLAHQIKVMDLMEQLQKEKSMTIVMVSHDLNLASLYGKTLLLVNGGKLVSVGSPDQVLNFETLEEAYGCTLLVDKSALGDFPRVTLVPGRMLKRL